ncbi:allantoicase [Paremcibacter congregatus]|uniref:allantoicase n=1 Tax=Paremcibacter congregatus TaxID=2043170 RepID=UPI003A95C852
MNVLPEFVTRYPNLAEARLGAKVVSATDDFFAPKERLISRTDPVFIPDKYDDHGKWMDGWESRRKRTPGHDHCVVKLAKPGRLHGVEIDTRHFTGNYPPAASLEACYSLDGCPAEDVAWIEVLPEEELQGDRQHFFDIGNNQVWTHIRLHIYPDGGVARLRVYGEIEVDWTSKQGALIDLAALEWGGMPLGCNDAHFGVPMNIITPGVAENMGDGWETRRRRTPGHDWAVFALAHPGVLEQVRIETTHFKGNYPDRFSLQAINAGAGTAENLLIQAADWPLLLPEQKLSADGIHEFSDKLENLGPVSHVRLNIYPDGGIARMRLMGRVTD